MYKTVLWDVDGTLLNFEEAEKLSFEQLFEKRGLVFTDELLEDYKLINRQYWAKIERHMIDKDIALVERFKEFFMTNGFMDVDAKKFNRDYQEALARNFFIEEGAIETCTKLKELGVIQYVITNGTKVAQSGKLRRSGLDQFMRDDFISEELGFQKPDNRFFDIVRQATHYNQESTLVVGDSLTSDIRGANNVGLKACWYNPKHLRNTEGVQVDYEIEKLTDLLNII